MPKESYTAGADIEIIHSGRVAPLTFLEYAKYGKPGKFDGGVYYKDGSVCALGLHIKRSYKNEPQPFTDDGTIESISGKHLFGGMLKNEHFGHFIVESLSRLWALRHLSRDYGSVVFYLRIPNLPIPKFAMEMFQLLEPYVGIRFVPAVTEFETLAVPQQIADPFYGFIYGHPAVRELMAPLRSIRSNRFRDVYVSRSKLMQNEGGILLEAALEKNLEEAGYCVVHPQLMSIREQLEVYNSAERLIFSEGSAIHLYALVARPEQKVSIIWRRKRFDTFDWQVRSFGGSPIHGEPRAKVLWAPRRDGADMVRARAALDFVRLREDLVAADFVGNSRWDIPSDRALADELARVQSQVKEPLVEFAV